MLNHSRQTSGQLTHHLDDYSDLLDSTSQVLRPSIHVAHLQVDLLGRLHGLASEVFDFRSHNRKAATRLTCTGGLDRRVQRQEVGQISNARDGLADA